MMAPEKSLTLAIVGGGIAGLTLTVALLTHCPHMKVSLYESAAAFGEIGAGVGFEPVMVRTMALIDPRIKAAVERCIEGNTVTDPPLFFTVRVGDERKAGGDGAVLTRDGNQIKLGEEIFNIPSRKGSRGGVHRAHFLFELVKLIPDGIAQLRKKLVDVREAEDGSGEAVLHFADGTMARHTAVLGCDGIKSRTRAIVLGDSDAASAVFSSKYAYRGLILMAKAIEIMGDVDPNKSQLFLGYHGHVLTFPIAHATLLNVVAFSSRPTWTDSNWVVQTSREDLREDYKHWSPTVRALVENLEKPDIWALFDHPPAPTYFSTSPLTCLVGDAAHASTPHQGAGAGMCIEDAWILCQVLSQCRTRDDIVKAFRAYDAVRRPRNQKMVETSREAGKLWDFEGEGISDDLSELERNAVMRMGWIWDHEIAADLKEAMHMLEA